MLTSDSQRSSASASHELGLEALLLACVIRVQAHVSTSLMWRSEDKLVLMSAPGSKLGLWLLWQALYLLSISPARWPGFEEIGNRVSELPTPGHLVTPHLGLADSPIHFAGFVPATVLSESRPVLLLPLMATEN